MPATDIQSLSGDLLLLVFHELSVADVLCVRRVCRTFAAITRAKVLWMNLLRAVGSDEDNVLPTCMKAPNLLDATALEALVVRVLRLARRWRNNDLFPVQVWRLNLCQSITWLRLVAGSWLFVASSDNYVSKITCWDMSLLFQNHMEPIAEAYLPGQVKTAQLEVQDSGLVIALGLGPSSPSVHIITLVQHLGTHRFAELYRVEGSSHILMLQGDFVGCAVRRNTIIPHIINWKTGTTYDLSPPPGVDEPHFRNTPHSLILWNEFIVVVRHDTLHFYSQPTSAGRPVYTKSVKTVEIWEVVVVDARPSEPLHLLVMSANGVEIIAIETDVLFNEDASALLPVATTSKEWPWYRLTANGSGKRALWISADNAMGSDKVDYPQLTYAVVSPRSPESENPLFRWTNDLPEDPALWAFPTLDFDEALGYTVVGNCFGELAIYDPIDLDPSLCCRLAPDFTAHQLPLPKLLPLTPIALGLNLAPRRPMGQTASDRSLTSHWTQDDLPLHSRFWCRNMFCNMYWDWDMWQGNLGDNAWLLTHAFGFPVLPIPQAHVHDNDVDETYIILRSGDRYLLFTQAFGKPIRSFELPIPRPLRSGLAAPHQYLRPTAHTECMVNHAMFCRDHTATRRNRWLEQQERGGRPHKNLVDTHTIDQHFCIDIHDL
ncbi:hypothetical protein C8F04DRAFT_331720 [Mycena alexandri]|uniref:F-box domain-containing protein n=1 Tax=Mycena alexandri TaxID=1745969 RepID=A0AAD6T5Q5_9AGAR|nr:hypothetical protein C8F04DRAFT_331720 [Mycena alexandri]